jgi:hypothetical protein
VHRIAEEDAFVYAAAKDQFLNGVGDVHEAAAAFYFEPKMLC